MNRSTEVFDSDILLDWEIKRPYWFYWTNDVFQVDLLYYHSMGVRVGEC